MRLKRLVTQKLPPMARESAWRMFKQLCAEQGGWLPWVTTQTEPQYAGMFRRRPRQAKIKDFGDVPEPARSKARLIFANLCQKWTGNLPSWRRAILAGRARWLALHPPDSAWGRRMRATRGGHAVQRKYLREGRHPLGTKILRQGTSSGGT